ncbi:MAG: hypothetical protein VW600_14490, partial [Ferrovibrio sp.]
MPKHAGEWQQYMVYTAQALVMLPAAVALLAMWAVMRGPHVQATILAMVIGAFAGFFFVLAYWATGMTHPNAIAGLIPWNDAGAYMACARELLAGAPLPQDCSMRPYYVAEFATFLAASGGHVQVALLLQSALLAGASGWFANRVARHGGVAAGLAVFAVLQVFIMQFALPVLTENAGLLLGMLAIAILFTRSASIAPPVFMIAMAILALALNARAGAMLVLPGLLAWSAALSDGDLRQRMVRSLYGVGGIVLALVYNFGFSHVFGGTVEQTHSNFAYTFYALSAGKSTYLQVYFDHPEINALSPVEARSLM